MLREFSEKQKIPFRLLSDIDSEVIRRYGILNEQVGREDAFLEGIPYPGVWAMYHYYYSRSHEFVDEMFVYYDDEYRKQDGEWRISRTGYRRVLNQILNRKDMPYKMKAPEWAVKRADPGA